MYIFHYYLNRYSIILIFVRFINNLVNENVYIGIRVLLIVDIWPDPLIVFLRKLSLSLSDYHLYLSLYTSVLYVMEVSYAIRFDAIVIGSHSVC